MLRRHALLKHSALPSIISPDIGNTLCHHMLEELHLIQARLDQRLRSVVQASCTLLQRRFAGVWSETTNLQRCLLGRRR